LHDSARLLTIEELEIESVRVARINKTCEWVLEVALFRELEVLFILWVSGLGPELSDVSHTFSIHGILFLFLFVLVLEDLLIEFNSVLDFDMVFFGFIIEIISLLVVLVPREVVLSALLLDLVDPALELGDLRFLLSDFLNIVLKCLLDVVPGDFVELTAWVVHLTLYGDIPAVVDEGLGLDDLHFNVVSEVLDDLLPRFVELLHHAGFVVVTALSTKLAGVKEGVSFLLCNT
jgi:hypothetical protein